MDDFYPVAFDDGFRRGWSRLRSQVSRMQLDRGNDTGKVQIWQAFAHATELRTGLHHIQPHGFSSMPLPGAEGIALFQNGHRGFGTLLTVVDPRYRPVGYNGGEGGAYMIDGAAADGTGGTLRKLFEGLLGWVHNIFGKTINIGDSNTTTIIVTGTSIKLAGNVEITGTLKVDGATTVQDINIQGTETGGGPD